MCFQTLLVGARCSLICHSARPSVRPSVRVWIVRKQIQMGRAQSRMPSLQLMWREIKSRSPTNEMAGKLCMQMRVRV